MGAFGEEEKVRHASDVGDACCCSAMRKGVREDEAIDEVEVVRRDSLDKAFAREVAIFKSYRGTDLEVQGYRAITRVKSVTLL